VKTRAKPVQDETRVELSTRAGFAVRFSRDCLSPANSDLADLLRGGEPFRRQRVLFLIDAGLAAVQPRVAEHASAYLAAHKANLVSAGAPILIEGGENVKNRPEVCDWLRARFYGAGLDARSHVVVVGGGAVLDAVGFAAATLRRAPRVTRVPTTLLAQASGALSPRCAVNALGRKDALCAFQAPFGVLLDAKWLGSLSDREKRAGLAEITRTALAADADFFHWLADHARALGGFERRALETAARWSARLHWESAAEGESFDPSRPAPLDFGRWAALRLEAEAGGGLLHGEAAAVGASVDLLLSVLLMGMPPEAARAALELIAGFGLPLWHDVLGQADSEGAPALLSALAEFSLAGGSSVPLLRAPGRPESCIAVNAEAVAAAIEALRRWGDREE
jgi:3-dehydroquinate synthase